MNCLVKHFIELRSVSPEGSAHVLDIAGLKRSYYKILEFMGRRSING